MGTHLGALLSHDRHIMPSAIPAAVVVVMAAVVVVVVMVMMVVVVVMVMEMVIVIVKVMVMVSVVRDGGKERRQAPFFIILRLARSRPVTRLIRPHVRGWGRGDARGREGRPRQLRVPSGVRDQGSGERGRLNIRHKKSLAVGRWPLAVGRWPLNVRRWTLRNNINTL